MEVIPSNERRCLELLQKGVGYRQNDHIVLTVSLQTAVYYSFIGTESGYENSDPSNPFRSNPRERETHP